MIKQTLALVGLTLTISANAAIVDLGNITRDTSTGLDWLDVTETAGLPYDLVRAEMGVGGAYEGYRYATMAELDQLIINFGYSAFRPETCRWTSLHCGAGVNGQEELVETMIHTLGDTYAAAVDPLEYRIADGGAGSTWGILGTSHRSSDQYDTARISDWELYIPEDDAYLDFDDSVRTAWYPVDSLDFSPDIGSFLVAPTPVPLPASGWLFMTALLGLVGKKRLARR